LESFSALRQEAYIERNLFWGDVEAGDWENQIQTRIVIEEERN